MAFDYSSLLGGGGSSSDSPSGGSPGIGSQGKGASTAANIFGNYADTKQTQAVIPWLVGGIAAVAVVFALVLIAVVKSK